MEPPKAVFFSSRFRSPQALVGSFAGLAACPHVTAAHCDLETRAEPGPGGRGRAIERVRELVALVPCEASEDEIDRLALRRRLPHTDPDPREIVSLEVIDDRLHTAVAGGAATAFHLHTAERQVELVVDHEELDGFDCLDL